MHYKWKQWQQDAGLDSKLSSMCKKRKEKRIEIYYHNHYISLQEALLAQMRAKLWTAKREYEEIDLDMALLDGRLSYVRQSDVQIKEEKKEWENMVKDVSKLTSNQRLKLIAELEELMIGG